MAITNAILTLSLIAGLMSVLLFVFSIFVEKNQKRARKFLIWAVLFLAATFAAVENAMWQEGVYLFTLVLNLNFPIVSYFAIWFVFIFWMFETRKERKIWIVFAVLLVLLTLAAVNCPNCLRI